MWSHHLLRILTLLCVFGVSFTATAQNFPNRPVRLIVPYAPGGTADVMARRVGKNLSDYLGQTVIIDNRSGAAGLVGGAALAQSSPDGYTIGLLATPHFATPVETNSSFDPAKLKPVSLIAVVPGLLCVNAAIPVNSLTDIIELARTKPGQLTYGNPGNFSAGHLAMELFKQRSSVDIISVPYRGGAPALQDLLGGRIQMTVSGPQNSMAYITTGQLRAIASTGSKRSLAAPNVPTFAESGMPGFELNEWYGIFAPNNTPPEIVARLNQEIIRALNEPDVRALFNDLGAEPGNQSVDEMAAFFRDETTRLTTLVGSLGFKAKE